MNGCIINIPSKDARKIEVKSLPNYYVTYFNKFDGIKSKAPVPIKERFLSTNGIAIDNPTLVDLNTKFI